MVDERTAGILTMKPGLKSHGVESARGSGKLKTTNHSNSSATKTMIANARVAPRPVHRLPGQTANAAAAVSARRPKQDHIDHRIRSRNAECFATV
jgi:hypothetical protein